MPGRGAADLALQQRREWPNSRIDELMPWHWAEAKAG
jgi:hypothetical protein